MPVYGLNSYVLACKSDDIVGFTINPLWASSKTLDAQNITFLFTGLQVFVTRSATLALQSVFPQGRKVWVDSVRVSIPNLSGAVAANSDINTGPGAGGYLYFTPQNGVDPGNTANNMIVNIPNLNEWIPISKLQPQAGMQSAGIYFQPSALILQIDFRNVDYTVFDGLTIFAYIEIKINSAVGPS